MSLTSHYEISFLNKNGTGFVSVMYSNIK